MSGSLRNYDALSLTPQCSLLRIITSYMRSVQKLNHEPDHVSVNLDLFHRHGLQVNPRLAGIALYELFNLIIASQQRALLWVHSLDAIFEGAQVVTLRIGHDGCLSKDTLGFRAVWTQLVSVSIDLQVCELPGGREEYVIQLPASEQLEPEPSPSPSFDLSLPGYPKVG